MTEPILRGRAALVTGATGRIGREIALSLAAEGVSIVAHYHSSRREVLSLCREIGRKGTPAWPLQADFSRSGGAESLVERAVRIAGKVTILVNSASLFTGSTAQTLTSADLSANLRVNAWAPLALGHALRRVSGKGAIVNLLDSRLIGGDPEHTGYFMSKHALMALTRMMAMEFAPRITVNAVAPGLIEAKGKRSARAQRLPLRHSAAPGDVAEAIVFLIKSRCVTGQIIWVDSGRHLRESRIV
jgi:pteridine reductase